ncbi:MAG: type Z 30S ribosomal protein S14 [Candidatus Peribacteraceae bacterium]|jgi:small subunit ribosomal protein S14
MARTALKNKQSTALKAYLRAKGDGRKSKFPTRVYNRCGLCGRRHGYMRFFGVCRICFRELAINGEIPGVTKSSW